MADDYKVYKDLVILYFIFLVINAIFSMFAKICHMVVEGCHLNCLYDELMKNLEGFWGQFK